MAAIEVTPQQRNAVIEVLADYVEDLFDAHADGRISADELRATTVKVVTASAGLVIPDSVEPIAKPLLERVLGDAWVRLDGLFRDADRLRARIATAEAEGKTVKAAQLREVLARLED